MNDKYLLFIDSLGSGGAQNQIVLLAKELKSKGNIVSIIYYHELFFFAPILDENEIKHSLLNKNKLGLISFLRNVRKKIKENQVTHIISFLEGPNFYASLIKLSLSSIDIKLIVSERSNTKILFKLSPKYLLKKFTYRIASKIMTNSNHERDNLIKQFIIDPKKIFTQYNFVELNRFNANFKKRFTRKLLVVGKPRPMKNGLLIIETMNVLKSKNKLNFVLHWIGDYNFKNIKFNKYVDEMNKRINLYNLSDYWHWSGPVLIDSSVYQDFDALVFPSNLEGLPNVVCESLASGIPVIISDILDHPILVENKKRGFTFDPKSSDELSKRIIELYNLSISDYNSMQKLCFDYATETFDNDKLYKSLLININK